jgi:hypothetical protein
MWRTIGTVLLTALVANICHGDPTDTPKNKNNDVRPYVNGEKPFIKIENVNRQAEAWAMCAAVYDIMSQILDDTPARSQQLQNLANGAQVAVTMTIVSDGLEDANKPDQFEMLWETAKLSGTELPSTRRTAILADLESSSREQREHIFAKLGETLQVCITNLEFQQIYIDLYRELAKSGLLKLPED